MSDYIREIIRRRKDGILSGVPSYCTANESVLRALIKNSKQKNRMILIEATSNQVNQDKGYTGMDSFDFVNYINKICIECNFDPKMVIKGGDHLGPLPWSNLNADIAMDKAEVLVRMSVRAGFKKIHLDTTMNLGDDPEGPLDEVVIAKRSARLYRACEDEYLKMIERNSSEEHPIFVIGSEVPYAGGIRGSSEEVSVTSPTEFEKTISIFHKVFTEEGIQGAWKYIIAIVVQPGVDFGANHIQLYNHEKSKILCESLKHYPGVVFEGHSTDYQPKAKLKEMVEDGIAVLKVGPALTFAYREALFSLSYIEDILVKKENRSHLKEVLNKVMLEDDHHWKKYYNGSIEDKMALRYFGLSDRSRYYFINEKVKASIDTLISNLTGIEIPMGMLHQFLPIQYKKIRDGILKQDISDIIDDHILDVVRKYEYATEFKYIGD